MHKCESRDREEAKDILISLAVKLCHVIGWERKEKDSGKGDYKLPSWEAEEVKFPADMVKFRRGKS